MTSIPLGPFLSAMELSHSLSSLLVVGVQNQPAMPPQVAQRLRDVWRETFRKEEEEEKHFSQFQATLDLLC